MISMTDAETKTEITTITLTKGTRDRLAALGAKGDSFETILLLIVAREEKRRQR